MTYNHKHVIIYVLTKDGYVPFYHPGCVRAGAQGRLTQEFLRINCRGRAYT